MTYSIVARDGATGQLGVAVQTAMFAVGSIVGRNHPSWEIIVRSFAEKGLMALPPGPSIDEVLGKA